MKTNIFTLIASFPPHLSSVQRKQPELIPLVPTALMSSDDHGWTIKAALCRTSSSPLQLQSAQSCGLKSSFAAGVITWDQTGLEREYMQHATCNPMCESNEESFRRMFEEDQGTIETSFVWKDQLCCSFWGAAEAVVLSPSPGERRRDCYAAIQSGLVYLST